MKVTAEVVYLRWFDSALYAGEACQPDDLSGCCENEAAGLLVAEGPDAVTVALDRRLDTGGVRQALVIPRVNIRFLRRFVPLGTE